MGLFENFPYTNFHELNLDWILSTIKKLDNEIDEFVQTNVLTYAEPIQWNITTQYAKNTVVVGPDGTAYMSITPVPTNIMLTNTDYWQPIFNYAETVTVLKKQIAAIDMEDSKSAIVAVPLGGLFWRLNTLYRATKALNPGDGFVLGVNCELCTVEDAIKNVISPASDIGRSGKNVADSAAETAKRTATNIIDSATETANRTATNIIDSATETAKRTAKNIIDSTDGDYTESSNHKTVEATQITEHTTANRNIDVDGAHSLHVDGTNTVNVGGPHTETYADTYSKSVAGVATELYKDTSSVKYTGTHSITGTRVFINTDDALQYGSVDAKGYVAMIDKFGNPYKLATSSSVSTQTIFIMPTDYGAVGDGVADDTAAIQAAFNATDLTVFRGYGDTEGATYKRVMIQAGKYKITSPIKFPDYGYFDMTGCLFINAIENKAAMFHSEHVHYLTIFGGYYAGNAFNFTSENLDQSRFVLSHTIIKGADTGIDFTMQSTSVEIRGNVFDHVQYPIIQRSSDMTIIDDNWFTSQVSSGIGSGNLRILGGEAHITNNVFVPIGNASNEEVAWIEGVGRTIQISNNRFGGENDGRTAVNIKNKYNSNNERTSIVFTNNLVMDTNPTESVRCITRMFEFPNTLVLKHNTFGIGCFRLVYPTTLNKTSYSATLSELLTKFTNAYSYGDMFGYQAFHTFDYDIDPEGLYYQEGDTAHGRSTPLQGCNWFWWLVKGYSKFLTKKQSYTSYQNYHYGQILEITAERKLPVYASPSCTVYVQWDQNNTAKFDITKNGTFNITGSASGVSVGLYSDDGTTVYNANTGLSSGRIVVKFSSTPSSFLITVVPNIEAQQA